MTILEPDSCTFVRPTRSLDSISRGSHDVAVGRTTSRACRRDQSIPSTSAASCGTVSRITPSLTGGHRKPPCSSRFQNRTSPDPSHAKIFSRSARFDRKMKIVPENGSCPSASRTRAARPSAPLRKSTGFVATSTFTPAATAIKSLPSRCGAHPAASRDQRLFPREPPRRQSRCGWPRTGSPPPRQHRRRKSPAPLVRTSAPRRPATSADRLAPPCANQTDAAVTCRAAAPPPTPPRRTHRIPRRSAPWSRRSSDAGVQPQPGYRPGLVAPKRQLYRRPYVRTDLPKLVRILPLKPPVTRWERSCAYDARLLPLIETLAASGADWLAFELTDGIRSGRIVEEFAEVLEQARTMVREGSFGRTPIPEEFHGDSQVIEPIAGDDQIDWAVRYIRARLKDNIGMLTTAFNELEQIVASELPTDVPAQTREVASGVSLVLQEDETSFEVNRTNVSEALHALQFLNSALNSWRSNLLGEQL